jgi:hypothetical protein
VRRAFKTFCALTASTSVAFLALSVPAALSAPVGRTKAHPTAAELRAILKVLPGQKLCFLQNAWISGRDRRYAVIVTQSTCGATLYNHSWLQRRAPSSSGPWAIVSRRSGTIDHPAGCAPSKAVPADIRCF